MPAGRSATEESRGPPPVGYDRYDLGDAGEPAGALSGCMAGRSTAGATLDLSAGLSVLGAACAEENVLLDMEKTSQYGSKDLLLVFIWG